MLLSKVRKQNGQALIVLMTFATIMIVLVLGMAAFELARYTLSCQQLDYCVDAASLGGAAGLTSSNNTNAARSQQIAIQTAEWIFEQNRILNLPLTGSTYTIVSPPPNQNPAANTATLNFDWLDPNTNLPTANIVDQKILRVVGAFGYQPLLAKFLGLSTGTVWPAQAWGKGGGPMLDVILCFDLSGSMDDSTPVSFVQRWIASGSGQKCQYYRVTYNGTSPAGYAAMHISGHITNSTGSNLNCCYPQHLSYADDYGGNLSFDSTKRGTQQGAGPGSTGLGGTSSFTDLVVNLDENDVFSTATYNGFTFPNLGTLVEAARGNLESSTIASNAKVDLSTLGVTAGAGWYQAYWQAAMQHRHPLIDGQNSASTFFQILNNSMDTHFGLIFFASDENTNYSNNIIDAGYTATFSSPPTTGGSYPTGNSVTQPIAYVALNPGTGSTYSNYSNVMNYLPPINPPASPQITNDNSTDINGALCMAIQNMLPSSKISGGLNLSRTGSRKAVVLFTDGLPSINTGMNDQDGVWISNQAGANNIPIYCIGLCQNSALVATQAAKLGTIADNSGAKFYQIPPGTNQAQALQIAFIQIARALVNLR